MPSDHAGMDVDALEVMLADPSVRPRLIYTVPLSPTRPALRCRPRAGCGCRNWWRGIAWCWSRTTPTAR